MVICPDCGKEVKDAKFCSNCGALLPKVEEVADAVENDVAEKVEETEEVAQTVENDVVEKVEEAEEAVETVEVEEVKEVEEPVIDDGEAIEVKTVGTETDDEPIEAGIVKKSKFCSNCGTEVAEDIAFCPQCGFKLQHEPQTKFCQSCGKKININAEICPHCGVRVAGVALSGEKSVLLAAILSFLFPGLGHLYNGLTKKGVSFIIAYIVSAVLIVFVIGLVLIFIVWVWALIDAIKTTESINNGEVVEDKLF